MEKVNKKRDNKRERKKDGKEEGQAKKGKGDDARDSHPTILPSSAAQPESMQASNWIMHRLGR